MIKISLLLFSLLLTGCSFKTPANEWQYKSSNAFNTYTKDFLKNNQTLANNDLTRAVKHAKTSADLTQLAKIYVGECALNISVGIEDNCEKYTNISDLVDDQSVEAYYNLLRLSIQKEQIQYLPKNYHSFAYHLLKKDFKAANQEIFKIPKATSSLLCASLIKENLNATSRAKIINSASYHGYKKVVLFWLNESLKYTENQEEIQKIEKKISILVSKD